MNEKNTMERWAEQYLKDESKYQNHVLKFINYIKTINKVDKPTNITIDDVICSIGHYNVLGKINTEKSMENHLEAIKSYYRYLVEKSYAHDIFSTISDYQGFKARIIEQYNLKEVKERESFDVEIVREILDKLDYHFESTSLSDLLSKNVTKRYFHYLVLRLFIKLTLVAPAKKGIICNIRKCDFSADYRSLFINGVNVLIPNSLRRDLIVSIDNVKSFKNRIFEDNNSLFKFLDEPNFQNTDLNAWFCNFLKEFDIYDIPEEKTTYSVEAVMNTAIYNMVRNAINPALIARINGTSISNLEKKYYKNDLGLIDGIDKLINYAISRNDYYNYV